MSETANSSNSNQSDINQDLSSDFNEPSTSKPQKINTRNGFSKLQALGILLLSLLLLSAGAGYYLWDFVNNNKTGIDISISNNQNKIANLANALNQSKLKLDQKIQNLSTTQNNLNNSVQMFLSKSTHIRKDWLISEAEFLVKLANHRLNLEADVNTAITALQDADARLNETGDPRLLLLRQELSNNLVALKAIPVTDISGISFKISSVINQIELLPLLTPDPKSYGLRDESTQVSEFKGWQEVFSNVTSELMGLVRIREHQNPVQPLIGPEHRFYLMQNLKLQLEQSRTALLHHQEKTFHERINQSILWLKNYFDIQNSATESAVTILAGFKNTVINPELPDISYALQMFKDFQAGLKLQAKPKEPEIDATTIKSQTQKQAPLIPNPIASPMPSPIPSPITPKKQQSIAPNKTKAQSTPDKGLSI